MILELIVFIVCIIFHEAGHYIPAVLFKASPKFRWSGAKLLMRSRPPTKAKGIIITAGGIIAGVLPLIVLKGYLSELSIMLLFAALMVGSHIDIRILAKRS